MLFRCSNRSSISLAETPTACAAPSRQLYPLAKSFIFINKPTVIIAYEDIEFIEFKRYEPVANSASRSFGTQEAHS
jgi:hypothetical protein